MTRDQLAPSVLTVEQVMLYTNLSKATIYRQLQAGVLTSIRIGRRRLFRREEVDRFLDEHEE